MVITLYDADRKKIYDRYEKNRRQLSAGMISFGKEEGGGGARWVWFGLDKDERLQGGNHQISPWKRVGTGNHFL